MAELYGKLGKEQQKKIQFVALNDDGAAASFNALKSAAGGLPTIQDKAGSPYMNALSNGDNMPKDDMAIIDKDGHMIRYFTARESNMGDKFNNNIRTAVMNLLKDDYKSPCAGKMGGDGKGDGDDGKGEMSPLEALKEHCRSDMDKCAACKGKVKQGKNCVLRKRLKCKFMTTEELCKKAKCKYKAPKRGKPAKCRGKGIF